MEGNQDDTRIKGSELQGKIIGYELINTGRAKNEGRHNYNIQVSE